MSCSTEVEPFLEALWDAALADSGVNPDAYHLLAVPGAPVPGEVKAACYPPRVRLVDDPGDMIRGGALAEANLPEHRGKHRIAIYEDIDEGDPIALARAGGVLRHEVRHGQQRAACGQLLFDLDALLDHIINVKVGGLARGAIWYRLKPIEADANAAAAAFLRCHQPGAIDALLDSDDGSLARSNTLPGALEDLPAKTVALIFSLREVAEAAATWGASEIPFAARLRALSSDAGDLWTALCQKPL